MDVDVIAPGWGLPDMALRLRKIGDQPGRLPATWLALTRGRYDVAHAFTPQDAAAALLWARLSGRPVVFSVCQPLRRAALSDRRMRLAMLRVALERSAAVLAPDAEVAESIVRWMAVEPRVIRPDSCEDHLALYRQVRGR
jgi:hypothetical protein